MQILPQLLLNALISGSVYALTSAGLAVTYGLLRILNFAHGHILMLGAYFFYYAFVQLNLSLIPAAALTAAAAIVLAVVSMSIFILPFSRYSYILPFITTLSLATILESVVSLLFGVNVKSLQTEHALLSYEFAGIFITPVQIIIITSS
ncbi:MAG: hypothetical protein J5J00_03080, partial [Deltaproteobacteria bacterium]|nr:hypothetical protein [Deltaproteobacteria bacterium]